ncbi:FeoA domain-containing protein [[Clostridium] symbiosum]|uniref:FeoA family protein n=1 Tax=Clostridium symbiosum TaxID=1512 RepID=UPI001D06D377|nr:FeoA domain-containing protein [[Clostridium] symbiosum]MCB6608824.1 FeoA domain-containing protein [[Clostridium] symbiosum]MCB6929574.1 FeoA domain-containing protein [[Clostridium] symbiosum]
MKLYEGEIGKSYVVQEVMIEERLTRRLEALGVNEHTKVTVLNKKKSGTLIINVRGTRLALGQKIADGIEIREAASAQERSQGGNRL